MKKFYKRLFLVILIVVGAIYVDRKYLIPIGIMTFNNYPTEAEILTYTQALEAPSVSRITIKHASGTLFLDPNEFSFAETDENHLTIHLRDGKEIRNVSSTLNELEAQSTLTGLAVYKLKSYLISLDNVKGISRENIGRNYESPNYKYKILLPNNAKVNLPKDQKSSFRKAINHHFGVNPQSELAY